MTTEKMNVHKALVELKLLNSRIYKELTETTFVKSNKHANQTINGISLKDYQSQIKDNYQSITDLIKRRNAIKSAVVKSNAETKITINGVEYSVAEAIDMKQNGIKYKTELLANITADYNNAQRTIELNNGSKLEERVNDYIASIYGKSETKNISDDVQKTRDAFIEAQSYELVDPLNVNKIINELKDEIDNFLSNFDSALSVSNAITEIEINY